MLQANQAMEQGMLESNLDALRTENHSLQQRLDKAMQELVRAATPSNPAVLRAFKVWLAHPACCRSALPKHLQLHGSQVVALKG